MPKLKELLAKGSGKYFDWKNKRANEAPARALKKKQRQIINKERLNERISQLKTRNRLIKAQNTSISLKKQRLRATLGFFTNTRPVSSPRRTYRRNRLRNNPRRAYKRAYNYEQRQNMPIERQETTKMWFER
jgi:hypothetical protein